MTPYDAIKTAWGTTDRRRTLNRAVEVLAADGVTRAELDAALVRLLEEVRAGGADDETEEEIMGVGDRLHGWCVESSRIQTRDAAPGSGIPLQPGLPTDTPAVR